MNGGKTTWLDLTDDTPKTRKKKGGGGIGVKMMVLKIEN